MKKTVLLILLLLSISTFSQQDYYEDIDFDKEGTDLKEDLATLIVNTHTRFLSYSPGVWEALKSTDVNPENASEVLLIYGYSTTGKTSRTRGINNNSGSQGDWNREHTFPKGLGNPNLETSGPGADAHHLRPSDVDYNSDRGSLKFANGSGNSGAVANGWYPGEEWKGDIARMMMYMYVRYGERCLPSNVGVGSNATTPDDMIDLFLEWNIEDPVSDFERQRNTFHENTSNTYAQGNRNPFIDNAYLATRIWGGEAAIDAWEIYITADSQAPTVPTNVVLSNITTSSISVSWTASTDNESIYKYEIFMNGSLHGETTTTNYTANGLNSNTSYDVTVLAKDLASNRSAQSTAENTTTLADNEPPSTPSEVTISNQTGNSFKISWNASTDNTGVVGYEVFIDDTLTDTTTETDITIIGLDSETTYNISVLAKDAAGNISEKSIAIEATTLAESDGVNCAEESFASMPANNSSYSDRTWTGDNGIEWNATKARTDQTINGRAIAFDTRNNNEGALTSSTFSGGVGNLTATTQRIFSGGAGVLDVSVNGIIIGTIPYDETVQTTTISDINITGNVTITINETTSGGDRVAIDDLSWTCFSVLNTTNEVFKVMKLYPNPTHGNTLNIETVEELEITTYTVLGKFLNTQKVSLNKSNIDISSLSRGIYFLKITSEKKSIMKKFIKN